MMDCATRTGIFSLRELKSVLVALLISVFCLAAANAAETREYDVTVKTGNRSGAGTDANVRITLYGENNGATYSSSLDRKGYNDFEKGDKDTYRISTEENLGEIAEIKLEHDNSGDGAGWYVEFVVVTDLKTKKYAVFAIDKWLAKDEGASKTYINKRRKDYDQWSKRPRAKVGASNGSWVKVCSGAQNCNNSISKSLTMNSETKKIWDQNLASSISSTLTVGGVVKKVVNVEGSVTVGLEHSLRTAKEVLTKRSDGYSESCGSEFDTQKYDIDAVWQYQISTEVNGTDVVVKTCDYMCTSGSERPGFWPGHPNNLRTCVVDPKVTVKDYSSEGCYMDAPDRDLDGYHTSSKSMTALECLTTCAQRGYTAAGTQYGDQCFCGNRFGKHGKANKCSMSCSGDGKETCGGPWANNVYRVKG